MTINDKTMPFLSLLPARNGRSVRLAGLALLALSAIALPSCGTVKPDRTVTHSVPDDYRTRHPITLAEVEHSLDVPVGAGDRRLNAATRDLIKGFAQDYAALSSGTVQIMVPDNAANSGAAFDLKKEIRATLADSRIENSRTSNSSY